MEHQVRELHGTQSIERAVGVLRLIAAAGERGVRLTDLVAETGLKQPTVSRLVSALARESLVEHDPITRRYFVGPEVFVLGAIASARFGIHKFALGGLARLAGTSEDSAFLSVPRDTMAVCLHREEGAFPIRTQVLNAGDRYPLGVGAGSLALLAAMTDEDVDRIIRENDRLVARKYPRYSKAVLWELVRESRAAGFAVNKGLVMAGSWGVGVPVLDAQSRPIAAFSIAAIETRLSRTRQLEVAQLLQEEARKLAETMGRLQGLSRLKAKGRVAAKG